MGQRPRCGPLMNLLWKFGGGSPPQAHPPLHHTESITDRKIAIVFPLHQAGGADKMQPSHYRQPRWARLDGAFGRSSGSVSPAISSFVTIQPSKRGGSNLIWSTMY